MIMLKVSKKQGFTLPLGDTFLEKPQGVQIETPAFLGLSFKMKQKTNLIPEEIYSVFYEIYDCYIFSNIDNF